MAPLRINKYLAQATGMSRRKADDAIAENRVLINGQPVAPGTIVQSHDTVSLDGKAISLDLPIKTVMLHKPVGYVCSRHGQGSKTIYDILPPELHNLKPVGRLDKDSSGLLIMTNDGTLAQQLSHPSFQKKKVYEVTLDSELLPKDVGRIAGPGVKLDDGPSRLCLEYINHDNFKWRVTMHEGRNRQIRRTFESLGYKVLALHRTHFGPYSLNDLSPGSSQPV